MSALLADSSGLISGLAVVGAATLTVAGAYASEALRRVRTDRASTTRDRKIDAAMRRHPAGSRR